MRIFFIILSVLFVLSTTPSYAHDGEHKAVEQGATASEVTVKIDGLVCDFCARAMEKVFGKREEVTGINVNLSTKIVTISMHPGYTIDDQTLITLINDSGYKVVNINRSYGDTNGATQH